MEEKVPNEITLPGYGDTVLLGFTNIDDYIRDARQRGVKYLIYDEDKWHMLEHFMHVSGMKFIAGTLLYGVHHIYGGKIPD